MGDQARRQRRFSRGNDSIWLITHCIGSLAEDIDEANYLLAIINSDVLATMPSIPLHAYRDNWSGKTRHLQKHLWKLTHPGYSITNDELAC